MKTVIMAGGKGTRISSMFSDIPKPMIRIEGKPILEYEIECLRDQGFTDLIITVSYLSSIIMDYFGNGSRFGVSIQYFNEKTPLGNGGALFKLRDDLTKDFLLLNADTIFDVDFNRFVNFHRANGGLVTLLTHPNSHPYDSGVLIADENGAVERWLTKESTRPQWYRNRVNAGLHVINPQALDMTGIDPTIVGTEIDGRVIKVDLDRQILKPLCGTGKMFCYDSPEYVKDMGIPERYKTVCRDLATGRVATKNLKHKQKAVFLDRDGTINKYVGFLKDIDEFELLPSVMETFLGAEGAYLDAIYYCPHHPNKGYEGEISELKIDCDCRKPKSGMFLRAAEEFNIDLSQSWMIGDGENDMKAGKAAGCRTILIGTEEYGQDMKATSLLHAVNQIMSK